MTLDPGVAAIAAAMIRVRKSESVEDVAAALRDARAAIDLSEKQPDAPLADAQPAPKGKRHRREKKSGSHMAA